MQTRSSRPRVDRGSFVQPYFSFLELPREIRDNIYELALEVYAEFYLRDLNNPWDHTKLRFCLPNLAAPLNRGPDTESRAEGSRAVLFYRFYLFHALMVTCKQVKAEVRDTFRRLIPCTHSYIRSLIRQYQVISDSPSFSDICRRSTFIFGVSTKKIIKFITQSSKDLSLSIRDLVFMESPGTDPIESPLIAWVPRNRYLCAFFPKHLLQGVTMLPNLSIVSIHFPKPQPGYNNVYMHTCLVMCQMVLKRQIEAVRYLCRNPTDAPPVRLLPYLTNKRASATSNESFGLDEKTHDRSQKLVYAREKESIFDAQVVIRIMLAGCNQALYGGYELWQVELTEDNVYF